MFIEDRPTDFDGMMEAWAAQVESFRLGRSCSEPFREAFQNLKSNLREYIQEPHWSMTTLENKVLCDKVAAHVKKRLVGTYRFTPELNFRTNAFLKRFGQLLQRLINVARNAEIWKDSRSKGEHFLQILAYTSALFFYEVMAALVVLLKSQYSFPSWIEEYLKVVVVSYGCFKTVDVSPKSSTKCDKSFNYSFSKDLLRRISDSGPTGEKSAFYNFAWAYSVIRVLIVDVNENLFKISRSFLMRSEEFFLKYFDEYTKNPGHHLNKQLTEKQESSTPHTSRIGHAVEQEHHRTEEKETSSFETENLSESLDCKLTTSPVSSFQNQKSDDAVNVEVFNETSLRSAPEVNQVGSNEKTKADCEPTCSKVDEKDLSTATFITSKAPAAELQTSMEVPCPRSTAASAANVDYLKESTFKNTMALLDGRMAKVEKTIEENRENIVEVLRTNNSLKEDAKTIFEILANDPCPKSTATTADGNLNELTLESKIATLDKRTTKMEKTIERTSSYQLFEGKCVGCFGSVSQ